MIKTFINPLPARLAVAIMAASLGGAFELSAGGHVCYANSDGASILPASQFLDVSHQVSVTFSRIVYNRATKLYAGTVNIANLSKAAAISGPLAIQLSNLTPGVNNTNADGQHDGFPFIYQKSPLAPGASLSVPIEFSNPSNAKISFTPLVYQLVAHSVELVEPPTFASHPAKHTLDLLMVAKPTSIAAIPGVTGWAYEICERKYSLGNACQPGMSNPNPYGGARLQLNPGDTLNIHFVNQLPRIVDSSHSEEPNEEFLAQNPTNIHTHGMLVSPGLPSATATNPVFGDTVFVLTFNSANGAPDITPASHIHGDVRTDATDYQIKIPDSHPSGLYWFHPHAHGISLNQVTAGLSGIITLGKVNDYMPGLPGNIPVRHLILKDIQVNGDKSVNDEEDPDFCTSPSASAGLCDGDNGGKWYFTVNGQLNPAITVGSAGQIWRITNASGSATYELQLTKSLNGKSATETGMAIQVLSIDGISVTPSTGISQGDLKQIGGAKFRPIACPGVTAKTPAAICATSLHMMPASRAEVWVVNRDAQGKMIKADGSQAIFQTVGYSTGWNGDNWPAVHLAQVAFSGGAFFQNSPVLKVLDKKHDATGLKINAIAKELAAANQEVGPDSACQPLPTGWKRRIFFGYPLSTNFGIGFELVDQHGVAVPGTFQDVSAFPNASQTICLPLGTGDTPVHEHWEVINLTGEDHNFHIHQTKFRVLTKGEIAGMASDLNDSGILQDSVPMPTGDDGCDGTVVAWRNGACQTSAVDVDIPFAIAGDFVFHCHILEHEDGGMMATIHIAESGDSKTTAVQNNHINNVHQH
ncbi:MAG: multicopper oxidase family protein [Methylococcales bacterium]|nr:multicopper oxidase family protein [Methylococcales bacterium]